MISNLRRDVCDTVSYQHAGEIQSRPVLCLGDRILVDDFACEHREILSL